MKKRLLFLVLVMLPLVASADTVEIDGIYYNLINKANMAEVTKRPSGYYTGSLIIPATISYSGVDYNVTSIGDDAFQNCASLTSMTIPNSVITIGEDAFRYCSGLNSLTISNNATSIGIRAFYGCEGLSSISIPSSVTSIGLSAFSGCDGLTSVHISDIVAWCKISFGNGDSNPLTYAHHLFLNDDEIKDITIPESVTSIGRFAFEYCSDLMSVYIPSSVTSIGEGAFRSCTNLSSVTISSSVTSIEESVFQGCSSLRSVTIPNSVTTIGRRGFRGCGITSVIVPNSVTYISDEAFIGCSSLTSIVIGNGCKAIDKNAFSNCPELMDVYCAAEQVPNTDNSAFDNSYIEHATLHVPANSVNLYKAADPWKNFKSIVAIDGEIPIMPKCATPVIGFKDGELNFTCETEGVEFVAEVTCADVKKYYDSSVKITPTFTISVYATKAGYDNSDIATKVIKLKGDVNADGSVDAQDASLILQYVAKKITWDE